MQKLFKQSITNKERKLTIPVREHINENQKLQKSGKGSNITSRAKTKTDRAERKHEKYEYKR